MEMLSLLLTLFDDNQVDSPHKGAAIRIFMSLLLLKKFRVAGDSRRHDAHMTSLRCTYTITYTWMKEQAELGD